MKKFASLILLFVLLSSLASPHIGGTVFPALRRDAFRRLRTDRHSNPTAMIWTSRVEAFFLSRGYRVKKGDPFPNTNAYHTLDMTAVPDPVKATIEYINTYGFYAPWGGQRWEHTAMSRGNWLALTHREKELIIQAMYNKENGTKGDKFTSSLKETKKQQPLREGIIRSGKKRRIMKSQLRKKPISPFPTKTKPKSINKKPAIKTVFEKTFTDRDRDRHGNIKAFAWNNKIQIGDRIEIIAKLPDRAKEVYIYRGSNRTPKWKKTMNGYFVGTIEHIPIGKSYYIWVEKGQNIETKVLITRQNFYSHDPHHSHVPHS